MFLNFFKENLKKTENHKYLKQEFSLSEIQLNGNRIIYFLKTPFFGNGRISYQGVSYIAHIIKSKNILS